MIRWVPETRVVVAWLRPVVGDSETPPPAAELLLVAERGGSPVAHAHARVTGPVAIWAGTEACLVAHSIPQGNKAVAAALVREAAAELAARGVTRLAINVADGDLATIRCVARLGFAPRLLHMVARTELTHRKERHARDTTTPTTPTTSAAEAEASGTADPGTPQAADEAQQPEADQVDTDVPPRSGMADLRIVLAEARALAALAPLWHAAASHIGAVGRHVGVARDVHESWEIVRPLHEARLEPDDEGFILLAEAHRSIVGYALVTVDRPAGLADLEILSVLPADRGRGIGAALIAAVMAELRARGVGQLDLAVLVNDRRAIRFYLRNGCAVAGVSMARQLQRRYFADERTEVVSG